MELEFLRGRFRENPSTILYWPLGVFGDTHVYSDTNSIDTSMSRSGLVRMAKPELPAQTFFLVLRSKSFKLPIYLKINEGHQEGLDLNKKIHCSAVLKTDREVMGSSIDLQNN